MIADEMSLEAFDAILNRAEFKVLDYPARYAYEGAGPRCLYARVGDDLDILYEGGVYTVFGCEGDGLCDNSWCVSFTDDGERERLDA
jgi:hypothetical protein